MKERRLKQLPVRNERRNSQIVMMVERRGLRPKQVAYALGLTVDNIYQIMHRIRSVRICQTIL